MKRHPLLALPTPVRRLEAVSHAIRSDVWVKDDGPGNALYGGSKTRKLELLLGDAIEQDAEHVVTSGGVGSNHAVATALFARQLGMRCTLLLMHQRPGPEVGPKLLASAGAGADLVMAGGRGGVARWLSQNPEALVIAAGGSSPLGDLAYASALFELADQVRDGALPPPDVIYVALGTMGCASGLALGLARELGAELVAVRASNVPTSTEARFSAHRAASAEFLDSTCAPPQQRVEPELEGGFLGAGYAHPTRLAREAVALAARDGLPLETTYTGKALAALLARERGRGRRVLFWNTHTAHPPPVGAEPGDLPEALRGYAL